MLNHFNFNELRFATNLNEFQSNQNFHQILANYLKCLSSSLIGSTYIIDFWDFHSKPTNPIKLGIVWVEILHCI